MRRTSHARRRLLKVLVVVAWPLRLLVLGDEYAPISLEDGSVNAKELQDHAWVSGECTAGAFVDYFVDVDASKLRYNLFLEVVYDPEENTVRDHRVDALGMYLYEEEIPADRESEVREEESADRSLSLAVNANDLREVRYYVSVKCGSSEDAKFGIVAEFIHAELENALEAQGHVCRDELLYFFHDFSSSADDHLFFKVCVPAGSEGKLELVLRVGAPPLRVTQPIVNVEGNGEGGEVCREFHACDDLLEPTEIWLGVNSIGPCTAYTVSVETYSNDGQQECSNERGDAWQHTIATRLHLEHVQYGSCTPYSWVDYAVDLTDDDRRNNLVFETRDVSDGALNIESLTVSLFTDEIPVDRISENRADRSVSNIFAIFKNYISLREVRDLTRVFVSVQCAETAVSYRILGEHVVAEMRDDHKTRGEVCPGTFIYHYVDMPGHCEEGEDECAPVPAEFQGANAISLNVKVHAFEGDLAYTILASDPPIRVAPPKAEVYALVVDEIDEGRRRQRRLDDNNDVPSTADADVYVPCVETARYYVGVKTITDACAVYEIEPAVQVQTNDDCDAPREAAYDESVAITQLQIQVPENHACAAGQYQLFSFEVSEERSHENLVVEVERRDEPRSGDTPDALGVYLYAPPLVEVPDDYETELYSEWGSAGIWSVSISSHDMTNGTYHLAVKCHGISDVSFSVSVILIQAKLTVGHRSHGEICPDNFVYHTVTPGAVVGGVVAQQQKNYRIRVWLSNAGDFYVMPRHAHPPLKLSPPYAHAEPSNSEFDVYLCDLSVGNTHYLGLLGGHRCAVYDAQLYEVPEEEEASCEEMAHFGTTDATLGALEALIDHSHYGGVDEGETLTYFVEIDEAHAAHNVIFEVHDLTDQGNPRALLLQVFQDSVNDECESELRSSNSANEVYSVAVPSTGMAAGTWFVTVTGQAPNHRVKFRLTVVSVATELTEEAIHGELFKSEWIVHTVTSPTKGLNFKVTLTKYAGEVYLFHRRREAPTIFAPPYTYLDEDTHFAEIYICDTDGEDVDYVGLYSREDEVVYEISVEEVSFDGAATTQCSSEFDVTEAELAAYDEADLGVVEVHELSPGHRELASCEPGHWAYFSLTMKGHGGVCYDSNLVFEVLADDAETNPSVLEVYLYENEIADSSERFSLTAIDGVYSLSVPMVETSEESSPDVFFVGVRCSSSSSVVRFSVVVTVVPGIIDEPGTSVFATACPGDHVYFQHQVDRENQHGRVSVTKYKGSFSYMIRENSVPLRLIYPYAFLGETDHISSMDLCDVEKGYPVWIAIEGGAHCASFFVSFDFFPKNQTCDEETNAVSSSSSEGGTTTTRDGASQQTAVALQTQKFSYGSCEAGSWSLKYFTFATCPGDNFVVELEQLLEDRDDPEAVALYAYAHGSLENQQIDHEADSVRSSTTAQANIHAVTFNYIDIIYDFAAAADNRRHFDFAVKCGDQNPARFRVLVHKFHAELHQGHRQNGEVCTGSWLFHFYSNGVPGDTYDCLEEGEAPANATDVAETTHPHLRFTVRLFRGHVLFAAVRATYPPSFNSREKHHLAELTDDDIPTADGTIEPFHLDVCNMPRNQKIYVGLFGGNEGCAIYDITATPFSGPCSSTFSRA
mmetsp:Transcript_14906/g.48653  ORF Transcript_14906/g.48653 Transcript_14906/m.48653 type:complete len:1617 (+) Transcript_14906:81-4931(+)